MGKVEVIDDRREHMHARVPAVFGEESTPARVLQCVQVTQDDEVRGDRLSWVGALSLGEHVVQSTEVVIRVEVRCSRTRADSWYVH